MRIFTMIVVAMLLWMGSVYCFAQSGYPIDNTLDIIPDGVETRWASPENFAGRKGDAGKVKAGRKGQPCFRLKPGQHKALTEVAGQSGKVRRIWFTISERTPQTLRGIKLEIFWDGAEKPAVAVPLGDFFGHSLGRMTTFESALLSSPEGRSFNCCFPMAFRTGMKMIVTNESNTSVSMYYEVNYTLGDQHGDNVLYFHSYYRRENPTTLKKDYELLPCVQGKGRFLGVNIGAIANKQLYFESWWGEGEVKIYLDGDKDWPTLCGTGTEDYIGTGWGQGRYDNLYQGCLVADKENMQYTFYRFHVPDPVYFRKDIRVTIQQIGTLNQKAKKQMHELGKPVYKTGADIVVLDLSDPKLKSHFERQDDYSSCAYFYLDKPTNNLPPIDPVEKRVEGL